MSSPAPVSSASRERLLSVDVLRGFVMFTMIFVNDLAGAPDEIVPPWMKHYHGPNGMTFVDLVFPAFLLIVGMSIPFAFESRLSREEPLWKVVLHMVRRTIALLIIGIMMVNESPDSAAMGWPAARWSTLMFLFAILSSCDLSPRSAEKSEATPRILPHLSRVARVLGWAGLVWLAFAFRGENGRRIVTLSPFSMNTEWYGILGLIGWAYLVNSVVYLIFRGNRSALLGSAVLLMCLYPAERQGGFDHFWLARYVGIGETLGSKSAITAAGMILASILLTPETASIRARARFTAWFIAGFTAAALLLHRLYGINKNSATPSWCLWSCAITAAVWLIFYFVADVKRVDFITKPLSAAGRNVLLAYLISEMVPSALTLFGLGNWYGNLAAPCLACAIARSAGCAILILFATALFNRAGFRLKL